MEQYAQVAAQSQSELVSSLRETPKALYTCPACKQVRLFKNRRILRRDGVAGAVCQGCFKNQGEHSLAKV